ncbi:hypothetical protein CEP54_015429 [Fusarium duplospermum]|uniref:Uncharacterized protein n=1 Tax=Fusarium duplospermum TaxID=1325734 RepID=A0A428NP76_9HYPO|nr:hypothetical protein CEP54_015429 [Fusarium duplospermum]
MDAPTTSKSQQLVIFNNDFPDSDNWAAALTQALQARKTNTHVVFILEARQVSLVSYLSSKEQDALLKAIQKASGQSHGDAFKALLNGFPGDYRDYTREWDLKLLSREERKLLRKIEKPAYDPESDAVLHAKLVAYDFASFLTERLSDYGHEGTDGASRFNIELLIDSGCLQSIENPVNLNVHHRDDIFGRNHSELESFEEATEMEGEDKKKAIQDYYVESIERKVIELKDSAVTVKLLDRKDLYKRIEAAKSVHWFGGCSLTLLQDVHKAGLAPKLNCCVQAVSAGLSDMDAAEYVFKRHVEFADFIVVPTHSAQAITYSVSDLVALGGDDLEQRILGFNFHKDPIEITRQFMALKTKTNGKRIKKPDHHDKRIKMPDLSALLCMIAPGRHAGKMKNVKVKNLENKEKPLLFEISGSPSDMKVYDLEKRTESSHILELVGS